MMQELSCVMRLIYKQRILIAVGLTLAIICVYFPGKFGSEDERYDLQKEICHDYSPAFPSAGGPGCRKKCKPKDGQKTVTFAVSYLNQTQRWPKDLVENMHLAGSILKKYGTVRSLDTERQIYLHVAFNYFCCYTESEVLQIGEFLSSYRWTPQTVFFDKIVCAISSPGGVVSLVLMADQQSQEKLLKFALENEQDLEKETGIHKNIPHSELQGFHMTLGSVNQQKFPVQTALEEINRVISPGKWHSTPVILDRPICRRCNALLSLQK